MASDVDAFDDPRVLRCRLLLMLGEEELLKPPFSIENPAHRRAVLAELNRVKTLGVKPPQNLWEYKVKSLLCSRRKKLIHSLTFLVYHIYILFFHP